MSLENVFKEAGLIRHEDTWVFCLDVSKPLNSCILKDKRPYKKRIKWGFVEEVNDIAMTFCYYCFK